MDNLYKVYLLNIPKTNPQETQKQFITQTLDQYKKDIISISSLDSDPSIVQINLNNQNAALSLLQNIPSLFPKKDPKSLPVTPIYGDRSNCFNFSYQLPNQQDNFYHDILYYMHITPNPLQQQQENLSIQDKLYMFFERFVMLQSVDPKPHYISTLYEKLILSVFCSRNKNNNHHKHQKGGESGNYLSDQEALQGLKYLSNIDNLEEISLKIAQFQPCKYKSLNCQFFDEKQLTEVHENTECLFNGYQCKVCGKIVLNLTRQRHFQTCQKQKQKNEISEPFFQQSVAEQECSLVVSNNCNLYKDKMLIVQNFPKNRGIFDIKQLLEFFGSIQNFSFKTEEKTKVLNFFCKFEKQEDAIYVKSQLDDIQLFDQSLKIEFHKSKEELEKSRVYVQGLETDDLYGIQQFLQQYGPVKMVKLLKNHPLKKKICYAEFEFMQDAQSLIHEKQGEINCLLGQKLKYSEYTLNYVEYVNHKKYNGYQQQNAMYQQYQFQKPVNNNNCSVKQQQYYQQQFQQFNDYQPSFGKQHNNKNNKNYNQTYKTDRFGQKKLNYDRNGAKNYRNSHYYKKKFNYNNFNGNSKQNSQFEYQNPEDTNSITNNNMNNMNNNQIDSLDCPNLLDPDFSNKLKLEAQSSSHSKQNSYSDGDSTDIDTNSNK